MLRIAIVGLGPWGACALERVVTTARQGLRAGLEIEVHVIEPGTPGSGIYDVTQPDYLLLNAPWPAHVVPVRHRERPTLLRRRTLRLGARPRVPVGRRSL